jgi:hypothetical protein
MKQLIGITFLIAVLASTACKKRDEVKSGTLNLDLEVEVGADSSRLIEAMGRIHTADNAAIAELIDEIDRYEIESMKYSVWELYGNDSCMFSGKLVFSHPNNSASAVIYTYNDFNFQPIEEKVAIDFTENQLQTIEDILRSSNSIDVKLEGEVSHKPIHFVLNVEMNVNAIAEK